MADLIRMVLVMFGEEGRRSVEEELSVVGMGYSDCSVSM